MTLKGLRIAKIKKTNKFFIGPRLKKLNAINLTIIAITIYRDFSERGLKTCFFFIFAMLSPVQQNLAGILGKKT